MRLVELLKRRRDKLCNLISGKGARPMAGIKVLVDLIMHPIESHSIFLGESRAGLGNACQERFTFVLPRPKDVLWKRIGQAKSHSVNPACFSPMR